MIHFYPLNLPVFLRKNIIIASLVCCFINNLYSQDYRVEQAYINDFGKNELYVKNAIIEYSETIIFNNLNNRSAAKLNGIIIKLNNINSILKRNDKGINNDTSLRDAFIKLNSKTISFLKNNVLILNDYESQSKLSIQEIENNFKNKELLIKEYYNEILEYEKLKEIFGKKHHIEIRSENEKEVLEYNALQNLTFYKMNVVDEKLMSIIKNNNDKEEITKCINFLIKIGNEETKKIDSYFNKSNDNSLYNNNKKLISLFLQQKEELIPLYFEYIKQHTYFKTIKKQIEEDKNGIAIETYNENVRALNKAKNNFYNKLYLFQTEKLNLVNNWSVANSSFLKRNLKFENIYEKFSNDKLAQNENLTTVAKKY